MHKVLITGITGFLGSHIAESLIQYDIQVIGLKRRTSDIWRCKGFDNQIYWIDIDDKGNWKHEIVKIAPRVIIHCAWIGVEVTDRDNWAEQIKNIYFLADLIEITKSILLSKFIFLGSQAEYGNISGKVSERVPSCALNAYSSIKLACLGITKTFCESNHINWIWLRVFSVFGEKENENWLIPSVIKKMLTEKEMDFTPAGQKYAYLYVKDFADIIMRISSCNIRSGVYNISSKNAQPLRCVIEQIRNIVNPDFKLNFGALPYRKDQSMHIEGDILKLTKQIGKIEFSDFNLALKNTIGYCLSKQKLV
ncbi:MAG TPA: NAD-dependent epimerase/dehydratase family protein [Pedobacter sp.]|jgi:nucleoside-diphosphate-sugar epimerase